ncbi:membrane protein of unknown function [Tenacibaculum jejuense]|uniref:Uncharacterized protein n=1 Tax=Tenacibaculum jejuense TaxID=584609 RepID=A0A238U683_9FLAO|nr:membrane protein of unknown function [Tenacibaculum jejuense]
MKINKPRYKPKWTAILIIGICLSGILIGNYVQRFRISEYRWIYQYGSLLNIVMVLGSSFWSFLHSLLVWSDYKMESRKHLIWIITGMIPFLYFTILMTYT